jgi:hypothetical protein
VSTNFLPLPSGGFIASQPKPCYTVPRLPTHDNNMPAYDFDQRHFSLDRIILLYQYYNQHNLKRLPRPSYLRIFYAHFIALRLSRPQDFLKGIRLLIIANHPVTVRPGRTLGRASGWLFFADLANLRRCPMTPQATATRPESPFVSNFPPAENLKLRAQ